MSILYVSAFSNEYFNKIFEYNKDSAQICAQKFNKLIIDGLKNNNASVTVLITYDPLTYNNFKSKHFEIIEDGVIYHFVPHFKIRFIGTFLTSFYIKKYAKKYIKDNKDCILLFDILKPYIDILVKTFYKKKKKSVAIVTDLPEYFENDKNSLINKMKSKQRKNTYNCISKYIMITKYMNEKINYNLKPSLVIEGLADSNVLKNVKKDIKVKKNIILYSGDLSKMYGLTNLIEAFKNIENNKYELHLYGRCDYQDELIKICEENPNIKYFGIVSNEIVVEKQKEAKILINPRPINLDFNKYSFPSKIIEYMASGTPVLTTKLQGIPEEYDEHLYYIYDDSIEGISKELQNIMLISDDDLIRKGECAKKFVINEKNNTVQAQKIINFIEK